MSIGIGFSTALTPLVSESIGKKNNCEKDFLNHGFPDLFTFRIDNVYQCI